MYQGRNGNASQGSGLGDGNGESVPAGFVNIGARESVHAEHGFGDGSGGGLKRWIQGVIRAALE